MTGFFPHPRDETAIASAISDLSRIFPGRCSANTATLAQHASTLTGLPHQPPDVVVFPHTIEEVQSVVAIARKYLVPLIPFGSGTSLEGQVNAPAGGICIDLSRMNGILRIGTGDLDVTVEPGVTLDQLNVALRDTGLFFPVDPGAGNATFGGMASTRASGTTTVRYGAMRENVLAMKVVLSDGTLISTGTRARKSAAGYDLTHLFIGAEGTLGIIVEVTLRLRPRPESVLAGVATFADVASAARATISAVQSGLAMQRIELLDTAMLKIVNTHSGTAIPDGGPALFVQIAGTQAATAEHLALFTDIVAAENGQWIGEESSDHDRRTLWKARHEAFWSVRSAFPGKSFHVTDVCVPVSRLADCLDETVADLAASGLTAPIVGHVGDGNFHSILVFDAGDAEACSAATAYLDRLAARAIAMEGTCTGEHGIGQGKAKYLAAEAGTALDVMRRVKASLDPSGLMNPGKIF